MNYKVTIDAKPATRIKAFIKNALAAAALREGVQPDQAMKLVRCCDIAAEDIMREFRLVRRKP